MHFYRYNVASKENVNSLFKHFIHKVRQNNDINVYWKITSLFHYKNVTINIKKYIGLIKINGAGMLNDFDFFFFSKTSNVSMLLL